MSQTFERSRVEFITIRELKPHPKVQRTFREWWAKMIESGFDPEKFRELYVVEAGRGNGYWVFDGQHRLAAAKIVLGEDQKVPCRVFDGLPIERQAELFLGVNNTLGVSALDKWIQRGVAKEAVATQINAVLKKHELRVDKTRGESVVQAVAALERIWKRLGGEPVLTRTLTILIEAWGRNPDAYDGCVLRGLALLVHRFSKDLDDADLARKLGRNGGPSRMLGQAKDLAQASGTSVERAMGDKILNLYNKARRTSRLEP